VEALISDFSDSSLSFFTLDCVRVGSLSAYYVVFLDKLGLFSNFLLLVFYSTNCLDSVMISLSFTWLFSMILPNSFLFLLELLLWNSSGFFSLLIWITRCIFGSLFNSYVIRFCFSSISLVVCYRIFSDCCG